MVPLRQITYLLVALLLVVGCKKTETTPTNVNGQVTYQGYPLPGGIITFTPDTERGSRGGLLTATIQTDGKFSLLKEDGTSPTPGFYRVAVAPRAGVFPDATPEDPYPGPATRYRNPEKSNLTCQIKAGIDNKFDFHLVD